MSHVELKNGPQSSVSFLKGENVLIIEHILKLFSLQAEGGTAVHHYSFDRNWLGLCQTHPFRQGQKDLHDRHPPAGTLTICEAFFSPVSS